MNDEDICPLDVQIENEEDLITVRKLVRKLALEAGLSLTDTTRVVTAASELGRNILHHAGQGKMNCSTYQDEKGVGIELIFQDNGPGIEDVDAAMQAGFTTSKVPSLGLGLPGTRRLVDDMTMDSRPGEGTTVKVRKWQARKQSY